MKAALGFRFVFAAVLVVLAMPIFLTFPGEIATFLFKKIYFFYLPKFFNPVADGWFMYDRGRCRCCF